MRTNPLANHGSSYVNAIKEGEVQKLKKIKDVLTLKRFILGALRKVGMVEYDGNEENQWPLHPREFHDVDIWLVSKKLLQRLINEGRIEIGHVRKEEGEMFMQLSDTNLNKSRPLVIHFTRDVTTHMPQGFQPVMVRTPSPFPYESNKTVSWRYGVHVSDGGQDVSVMRVGSSMPTVKVTNIFGMSGMTCSGHVCTPLELLAGSKNKGKTNENVIEREKMDPIMNNETPIEKPTEKEENSSKKKMMQSYPVRALDRRLQVDWVRDARQGLRVLKSLRVDFEPMG